MKIKITFHNMPHSDPLEAHAREKLAKIEEYFRHHEDATPFNVELWLKASKQHPHHAVELHLEAPEFSLDAHDEGPDMYIALDSTIDKMISQIIKEKERVRDKYQKPETAKKKFSS